MGDKIKKIKIKQQDGTMSDYYPIGANASDIDLNYNNSNVENTLKKKPYYYNNIADMKADDTLQEGDMAITLGYYTANDGGGAEYRIVSGDYTDNGGTYHKLLNENFAELIIKNKEVCYNQFGAYGDGEHEDWQALYNTHNFANEHGYTVIGNSASKYYICNINDQIIVNTNVNWKNCTIIIDDSLLTEVDSRHIFYVKSTLASIGLTDESGTRIRPAISKTDTKLSSAVANLTHSEGYIVEVLNKNKEIYVRKMNSTDTMAANWASAERLQQQEVFRVDDNLNILDPISWDYEENGYTSIVAYPIDSTTLTIENATIITKANLSLTSYLNRDIQINRSNVTVNNITHLVENNTSAHKYNGFMSIRVAANVNINNCNFTGHTGSGTYDIILYKGLNITLNNVKQLNSIMKDEYWGIFASSLSKNVHINNCYLNRIDAHMGIYNLFINDCIIGRQQIQVIGGGICQIEDTTVYSDMCFLNLRMDYGSTFEGDIILKNCKLIRTSQDATNSCSLIYTHNNAQWDFGYKCYLGKKIVIENFIYDNNQSDTTCNIIHLGGSIDVNASVYSNDYETCGTNYSRYPYILASQIQLKNIQSLNNRAGMLFYGLDFFRLWMEDLGSMPGSQNRMGRLLDSTYNCIIDIDNCIFGDDNKIATLDTANTHQNSFYMALLWPGTYSNDGFVNTHHPIVKMNIKNCDKLQIDSYYRPIDWEIENSSIYHITNLHKSSDSPIRYSYYATFVLKNCKICYGYDSNYITNRHFYILGNNYSLDNCMFINKQTTDKYKSLKTYGNTDSRPTNELSYEIPQNFVYYDTTLSKNIYWNNGNWYAIDTNEIV